MLAVLVVDEARGVSLGIKVNEHLFIDPHSCLHVEKGPLNSLSQDHYFFSPSFIPYDAHEDVTCADSRVHWDLKVSAS